MVVRRRFSYDAAISIQTLAPPHPEGKDGLARAAVEIPREWLMRSLDKTDVERVQRDDTVVEFGREFLRLLGIELVIQRCWFREGHWLDARRTIVEGYIHRKTWVELVLRGDRRRTPERLTAVAHTSGNWRWHTR